ncbi:MAG TPA: LPXTG cell wall anchor domain-containing protein [Acidimicrobiales bacterium]|nr:LPXTG cell wall anchor domain-containing protein [Acidimicrobiales bacterium]
MLAIPAGAIGLSATAAFAVPGASTAPPATQVVGTGGSTGPSVQALGATAPSGSSLPLTGGDVAGLTVIGIALVGGGAVIVRRTRARTTD